MLRKKARTLGATKAALREFKRTGGTLVRGFNSEAPVWEMGPQIAYAPTFKSRGKDVVYIPKKEHYRKLPFFSRVLQRFNPAQNKLTSTPRSVLLHELGHAKYRETGKPDVVASSKLLQSFETPVERTVRALKEERGANLTSLRDMRKHIRDSLMRKRESDAFRRKLEVGYRT